MTRLDLLDPTSAGDPAFDPHGAQAQRVRQAATSGPPRRRPAPRRRLALAGATVAAAAAVALTLGTATRPPDARAELARAVERTAAFDSGRILLTHEWENAESRGNARTQVRFDDGDLEAVMRSEVVAGGRTMLVRSTSRQIDGVQYARDDTRAGARFERLGEASATDPARLLVEQIGSKALVDLVRGAKDLEEREGPDGATVYRGTRTAGEVEDAAPTAAGRSQGSAWERPVTLEVTVAADGVIRRVKLTEPDVTRTIAYAQLGEDQSIERPAP